ncbi:MAG: FkbM family methyltransferase [Jatrophihabitans sp.]|nr:MAG: FkbM family methyltransferase [Jatrophihabitans sp.]
MRLNRTNVRIGIDRLGPNRPVRRCVRGMTMVLPRRHLLPYMATEGSPYAQNLVDLAQVLGRTTKDLVVLDVGANVGDSALLIRDRVRCRIVCVEGDPYWLDYLDKNVAGVADVVVEPVLLSADGEQRVDIVRADVGTSRVRPARGTAGTATVPVGELLARRPELDRVRLVKSDTDGFDLPLALAYARTFSRSRPVIFFEYDPRLCLPGADPAAVWGDLAGLGYERATVWTNGGHVLGTADVRDLGTRCRVLTAGGADPGYQFWDVAVAHRDDADGCAALDEVAARGVQWQGAGRV